MSMFSAVTVGALVVGVVGIGVGTNATPSADFRYLDSAEAASLYATCMDSVPKMVSGNADTVGHFGTDLLLLPDSHKRPHTNDEILIGAILNKNQGNAGEPSSNYKSLPAGYTCIYMVGTKGPWAKVVYWRDKKAQGQHRTAAIISHYECHVGPKARWDEPIEEKHPVDEMTMCRDRDTTAVIPSGAMHSLLLPHGANRESNLLLHLRDDDATVLTIRDIFDGPWYTCSTNTCCKAR
jgi:hypothetical protein